MKSERISPFWVGGYQPFSAPWIDRTQDNNAVNTKDFFIILFYLYCFAEHATKVNIMSAPYLHWSEK